MQNHLSLQHLEMLDIFHSAEKVADAYINLKFQSLIICNKAYFSDKNLIAKISGLGFYHHTELISLVYSTNPSEV